MQKKSWAGLLIILTTLGLGVVKYFNKMSNNKNLQIWSSRVPYSLDPLDYDALAHHICFRSVYSSLVSDYKLGEVKGILASKWWSSSDKTNWSFQIRDDVSFSDGQKIEAKDVAFSLNRAALLMKRANSESGLLENLEGVDAIVAANKLIAGITFDKNVLTLKFQKAMDDVLAKISFGLYAIVSTKNFDSVSGEWRDKKSLIGSGPYNVEKWTDTELTLALRSDFPKDLLLSKPITRATFHYSAEAILNSDLVVDFDDSLAVDGEYKFFGPVKSAIRYIECEGWQNPKSICYDKDSREFLRNSFYSHMHSLGFNTVKSFFPLAIKGVSELEVGSISPTKLKFNSKAFTISKVASAYKSSNNKNQITAQEAFESGMNYLAKQNDLEMQSIAPVAKLPTSATVDFRFRMTAILVDTPHHDIRFMLNSAHGIRLPDSTGEIKKYVLSENFSVQTVNKMLWDQAIIWPLGHMALGLWKKEGTVNLASYNLILPPLDLQWIEWE